MSLKRGGQGVRNSQRAGLVASVFFSEVGDETVCGTDECGSE